MCLLRLLVLRCALHGHLLPPELPGPGPQATGREPNCSLPRLWQGLPDARVATRVLPGCLSGGVLAVRKDEEKRYRVTLSSSFLGSLESPSRAYDQRKRKLFASYGGYLVPVDGGPETRLTPSLAYLWGLKT